MGKILVNEVEFGDFSIPVCHEEILDDIYSFKEFRVVPVEYYVVKSYNSASGEVEHSVVLTLKKSHPIAKNIEKFISLLSANNVSYTHSAEGNVHFIAFKLPADNEHLELLKRVGEKVREFQRISAEKEFYVGIVKGEIYIERGSVAPIKVKRLEIDPTDDIVSFVMNYFDMPKILFKVREDAIIVNDFSQISFRFGVFRKPEKPVAENKMFISYTVPKDAGKEGEVIILKMNSLVEELKEYDERLAETSIELLEKVIEKHTPNIKDDVMELIRSILSEKRLKIVSTMEAGKEFGIDVVTPDGVFHSDDFIPAFVLRKLVKTYYDNLLFNLIKVYVSEVKKFEAEQRAVQSEEGITEEKKDSFLNRFLSAFKKKDKEAKPVEVNENQEIGDPNELFVEGLVEMTKEGS